MSAVVDDLALYRRLVGSRVRSQLQYRTGFAVDVVGVTATSLLDLVTVLVLFANVPALAGWSVAQCCLLYGTAQTSFALADSVFGQLDTLPTMLRSGEFDNVLLKPRSSLLLTISSDFSARRIGQLAQALVVLALAWASAGVTVTPGHVALAAVTVVAGFGVFGGIWIIGGASTFWTIDTMEITNSFTYGGRQMTSYPMTVYGRWLRRFVTFAVPLACVAYFPVRYLVGLEPSGSGWWVRFAGVAATAGLAVVASVVWRAAVRSYRGTGS